MYIKPKWNQSVINQGQEFAKIIWFCVNIKYQIQIFSNTLKTIINKSNNTKCSRSLSSTNPNITKQLLQYTNTEVFKFLRYLVVPPVEPRTGTEVRPNNIQTGPNQLTNYSSHTARVVCQLVWPGLYLEINHGQAQKNIFGEAPNK